MSSNSVTDSANADNDNGRSSSMGGINKLVEMASEDSPKQPSKKSVSFDGVTVFYFPRVQGFTCVPSQGGSTLGMGERHMLVEKFSLGEYSRTKHEIHRNVLLEHHRQGRIVLPDNFADISQDLTFDDYYFLQPVPVRQRRALLHEAGIRSIDPTERDECRTIRTSRGHCGCACRVVCEPSTCACYRAGIQCQVDQMSFPCGCTREGCANQFGRVEFNAARVRAHFVRTLLKMEIERECNGANMQQFQECGNNQVLNNHSLFSQEGSSTMLAIECGDSLLSANENSNLANKRHLYEDTDSSPPVKYTRLDNNIISSDANFSSENEGYIVAESCPVVSSTEIRSNDATLQAFSVIPDTLATRTLHNYSIQETSALLCRVDTAQMLQTSTISACNGFVHTTANGPANIYLPNHILSDGRCSGDLLADSSQNTSHDNSCLDQSTDSSFSKNEKTSFYSGETADDLYFENDIIRGIYCSSESKQQQQYYGTLSTDNGGQHTVATNACMDTQNLSVDGGLSGSSTSVGEMFQEYDWSTDNIVIYEDTNCDGLTVGACITIECDESVTDSDSVPVESEVLLPCSDAQVSFVLTAENTTVPLVSSDISLADNLSPGEIEKSAVPSATGLSKEDLTVSNQLFVTSVDVDTASSSSTVDSDKTDVEMAVDASIAKATESLKRSKDYDIVMIDVMNSTLPENATCSMFSASNHMIVATEQRSLDPETALPNVLCLEQDAIKQDELSPSSIDHTSYNSAVLLDKSGCVNDSLNPVLKDDVVVGHLAPEKIDDSVTALEQLHPDPTVSYTSFCLMGDSFALAGQQLDKPANYSNAKAGNVASHQCANNYQTTDETANIARFANGILSPETAVAMPPMQLSAGMLDSQKENFGYLSCDQAPFDQISVGVVPRPAPANAQFHDAGSQNSQYMTAQALSIVSPGYSLALQPTDEAADDRQLDIDLQSVECLPVLTDSVPVLIDRQPNNGEDNERTVITTVLDCNSLTTSSTNEETFHNTVESVCTACENYSKLDENSCFGSLSGMTSAGDYPVTIDSLASDEEHCTSYTVNDRISERVMELDHVDINDVLDEFIEHEEEVTEETFCSIRAGIQLSSNPVMSLSTEVAANGYSSGGLSSSIVSNDEHAHLRNNLEKSVSLQNTAGDDVEDKLDSSSSHEVTGYVTQVSDFEVSDVPLTLPNTNYISADNETMLLRGTCDKTCVDLVPSSIGLELIVHNEAMFKNLKTVPDVGGSIESCNQPLLDALPLCDNVALGVVEQDQIIEHSEIAEGLQEMMWNADMQKSADEGSFAEIAIANEKLSNTAAISDYNSVVDDTPVMEVSIVTENGSGSTNICVATDEMFNAVNDNLEESVLSETGTVQPEPSSLWDLEDLNSHKLNANGETHLDNKVENHSMDVIYKGLDVSTSSADCCSASDYCLLPSDIIDNKLVESTYTVTNVIPDSVESWLPIENKKLAVDSNASGAAADGMVLTDSLLDNAVQIITASSALMPSNCIVDGNQQNNDLLEKNYFGESLTLSHVGNSSCSDVLASNASFVVPSSCEKASLSAMAEVTVLGGKDEAASSLLDIDYVNDSCVLTDSRSPKSEINAILPGSLLYMDSTANDAVLTDGTSACSTSLNNQMSVCLTVNGPFASGWVDEQLDNETLGVCASSGDPSGGSSCENQVCQPTNDISHNVAWQTASLQAAVHDLCSVTSDTIENCKIAIDYETLHSDVGHRSCDTKLPGGERDKSATVECSTSNLLKSVTCDALAGKRSSAEEKLNMGSSFPLSDFYRSVADSLVTTTADITDQLLDDLPTNSVSNCSLSVDCQNQTCEGDVMSTDDVNVPVKISSCAELHNDLFAELIPTALFSTDDR